MKKHTWFFTVVICANLLLLPGIAAAAEPTLSEYQELLIQYSILIGAAKTTEKLEALPEDSWQFLYETDPSKQSLVGMVNDLTVISINRSGNTPKRKANSMRLQSIATHDTVDGEFEPKYPDTDQNSTTCASMASPCYGYYIRRDILGIPNFLFSDESGSEPGIKDDRCDEQTESVLNLSYDDRYTAAIVSQAACDATPDIGAWAVCGLTTLPLWELVHGTEQKLRVCELHGGNVDSAETEATYENTRTILANTNSIKGDTADIRTVINNEVKFTDDEELSSHNTEILQAISVLNGKLDVIDGKLSDQQQQLNLIVELLETPQGRRPDWNEKP